MKRARGASDIFRVQLRDTLKKARKPFQHRRGHYGERLSYRFAKEQSRWPSRMEVDTDISKRFFVAFHDAWDVGIEREGLPS